MDLLHLHLLLNHVPAIGMPIGAGLLAWGILRRERAVARAALGLLLLVGLSAAPVFLTGEPAEERVENVAGVSNAMIERHEGAAKLALGASLIVCAVAAVGLFASRRQRELSRGFAMAGLVASTVAVMAIVPAAYLGGNIRHTELRGGADAPAAVEHESDRER